MKRPLPSSARAGELQHTLIVWPIQLRGLHTGPESCGTSWADLLVPWMQMAGEDWPHDVHKEIKSSGAAFTMLKSDTQWVVIVNCTPSGSVITGNDNKAAADRYRALQDRLNSAMRAVFQIAAQGMQDRPIRKDSHPHLPDRRGRG